MNVATPSSGRQAIRGSILHFVEDPARNPRQRPFEFYEDGVLLVVDGHITKVGHASELLPTLGADTPLDDCSGNLILPGFIDAHVHFVQTDIIGSYGRRLLEWLEQYTFPAERAFADPRHAREVAEFFVGELLRNGTTTALVLGSVHATSVDAIFNAAAARGMRLDRRQGADGSQLSRLSAGTRPRRATRTRARCSSAGTARGASRTRSRLASHRPRRRSNSTARVGWRRSTRRSTCTRTSRRTKRKWRGCGSSFPIERSYLDVYDHYRPAAQAQRAGARHLARRYRSARASPRPVRRSCTVRPAICSWAVACSTFNGANKAGVRVALGTDVGGGTSSRRCCGCWTRPTRWRSCAAIASRRSSVLPGDARRRASARSRRSHRQLAARARGDFIVLDPTRHRCWRTPIRGRETLEDRLFLLMTLGDDRVVSRTYVMGRLVHRQQRFALTRGHPCSTP